MTLQVTQPSYTRRRFTVAEYDREVRLPRYARAGIPEVWLLGSESGAIAVAELLG